MTIKEFIEKAIEGGWEVPMHGTLTSGWLTEGLPAPAGALAMIILNPHAWQAVGKVEGWDEERQCYACSGTGYQISKSAGSLKCDLCDFGTIPAKDWEYRMHRMIDALAEGKSIEEFLASLI